MIRFVYVGDQILDGRRDFALYDTVRDRFMRFSGTDVWGSWESLEEDLREDGRWTADEVQALLARVRAVIPCSVTEGLGATQRVPAACRGAACPFCGGPVTDGERLFVVDMGGELETAHQSCLGRAVKESKLLQGKVRRGN